MFSLPPPPSSSLLKVPNLHPTPLSQRLKQLMLPPPMGPKKFVTYILPSVYYTVSQRKHPFLLALRRWGRFARNVPSDDERGEMDVFAGYSTVVQGVDKTRNTEHSGTCRNIPETPGTSPNIKK